jgi:two-component system phosphate regulon sensor histidine kinase PhoR
VIDAPGGAEGDSPARGDAPLPNSSEQLADALRSHEQFLSAVVHDLRTPLTSLKGYAQLAERRLDRGQFDAVRQSLRVIDREITKMTRMLQLTLDAGRLEAGVTKLRRASFDLRTLVDEVAGAAAAEAGRDVTCEGSDEALRGTWDHERLAMALSNVIGNALQYSPPGSPVVVSLRRVGSGPDEELEIAVRDEGIGLRPQDLERVFDRFYRAPNVTGDGMGLGLYVARGILALHGGRISAESAGEGRGSTFTIRLPLGASPPESAGG